jgi:HEAT repeat protein
VTTPGEVERWLVELGDARKAIQRPAAEALADAARATVGLRARLVDVLGSADGRRRWGAAYALARLETVPREAVPTLLEALGSADGDLRWASARILVRAAEEAPELGDAIRGMVAAPSPLARKMALYCLRDLGAKAAIPIDAIVRTLEDTDPAVRLAALAAISALHPGADAADHVAARLADVDAGVRRAAAATLGQLAVRTPTVEAALATAVSADDPALVRVARAALSRLGACSEAR